MAHWDNNVWKHFFFFLTFQGRKYICAHWWLLGRISGAWDRPSLYWKTLIMFCIWNIKCSNKSFSLIHAACAWQELYWNPEEGTVSDLMGRVQESQPDSHTASLAQVVPEIAKGWSCCQEDYVSLQYAHLQARRLMCWCSQAGLAFGKI